MKTFSLLALSALLASCSTFDIDAVRLSGGPQRLRANAQAEGPLGRVTDTRTEPAAGGRVELVNKLDDQTEAGLLLGSSLGSLGDVDFASYDVGASVRHFLGSGSLRPFGELAAGYRRFEVEDDLLGDGSLDMLFGSAAIGLELRLSRGVSFFVSGGYEAAFGSDSGLDFDTGAIIGHAGFAISF